MNKEASTPPIEHSNMETDLSENLYDILQLQSYFQNGHMNEPEGFNEENQTIGFNEANAAFPNAVKKNDKYFAYDVVQGGRFYVFWISPLEGNAEKTVYFSAYVKSDVDASVFDSLKIGESTAEDVKELDPDFECVSFLSNAIYSYSYLNEKELIEIRYTTKDQLSSYHDLIVEEIKIIPREYSASVFGEIQTADLP